MERLIDVKLEADAVAIGIVEAGELIAAVVYDRYTGHDICMHVAALPGKHWCSPEFRRTAFSYPFGQLNCRRVTGLVAASNTAARKFDEHLGFVLEGTMRQCAEDGGDLLVYGMLRDECRWINR
ncbi:GNAT family protein [Paraburkholderia unamae]|uniref:GNAT family protein n=1 Tax=Paraburkholderia unamae TaxID=219649 RepID=A0ACC6RH73_9BURK